MLLEMGCKQPSPTGSFLGLPHVFFSIQPDWICKNIRDLTVPGMMVFVVVIIPK